EASKQRVNSIVDGLRIGLRNVYTDGAVYTGGPSALEIENASPYAASVRASFGYAGAIEPAPHEFSASVAAGQTTSLPIALRTSRHLPISELRGVPFEWSATVDTSGDPLVGRRTVELSGRSDLAITRSYAVTRRHKPVVVDGKLD